MILAAGLGTRLRPLTEVCAKPALPVRGVPVIATLLEFLAHHDIREVVINLHYLPETVRSAVERWCPPDVDVHYSEESEPLGTGGGIRQARSFLMESETSVVLAGDMLLDFDLTGVISRHIEREDLATLVVLEDSRVDRFGSIGVGKGGAVRRIASSLDLGGESAAGLFTGVRVFSREALEAFPEERVFEDLRDFALPALERGSERIRAELYSGAECTWEPVGTTAEYLHANMHTPRLSYLDLDDRARRGGVRFEGDNILGRDSAVAAGARLERCIVFEGEHVDSGCVARDAALAGGRVHTLVENA